jgi:predicted metalloprotease with PDZ domain
LRAGLIDLATYVDAYNEVLHRYHTSPVRDAPNQRIADDFWEDDVNRLPYHRGDIAAHEFAYVIKTSHPGTSLDDVMRDILLAATTDGRVISNDYLRETLAHYVPTERLDEVFDTIENGAVLTVSDGALGPCMTVDLAKSKKFKFFGSSREIPQYRIRESHITTEATCLGWLAD